MQPYICIMGHAKRKINSAANSIITTEKVQINKTYKGCIKVDGNSPQEYGRSIQESDHTAGKKQFLNLEIGRAQRIRS